MPWTKIVTCIDCRGPVASMARPVAGVLDLSKSLPCPSWSGTSDTRCGSAPNKIAIIISTMMQSGMTTGKEKRQHVTTVVTISDACENQIIPRTSRCAIFIVHLPSRKNAVNRF